MILSTSSSRAVSIRIGTSERWRILRQTSIPSTSGSIRSSTIRSAARPAALSASWPVPTVLTRYPAFVRYSETNEAIDASSSTTNTFWT